MGTHDTVCHLRPQQRVYNVFDKSTLLLNLIIRKYQINSIKGTVYKISSVKSLQAVKVMNYKNEMNGSRLKKIEEV